MAHLIKLLLLLLCVNAAVSFKLKLPRVLLPLMKFSSTNFTVESSGSGCYKWSLSRLDIIQIVPLNLNKQLDCSSQVILSTITKEFTRNTVIVLVEEVSTKETFRFDVIVDVISFLNIVTHTRQLFVEESPEIFEVRAYDDQGNEFSTLEGVQFSWTISSGGRNDVSPKNNAIRFINFKDSAYENPQSIQALDSKGLTGHLILLEGVKTGTSNVSVELSQYEYRHVPPAVVQLNVIANLIIEPSDTYILRGDVIYYKLIQMKNGRFVEVQLPSAQYSLIVEDDSVAKQIIPWAMEALVVGQTRLILSDINSKMSDADAAAYLPSVTLNVVSPAFMNLVLLPYKNWITTIYQPNAIVAEVYDSENHKIYLGPYAVVKIDFDSRFKAVEKTSNGSYIDGYANAVGTIHVTGELNHVRTNDKVIIPLNRVTTEADILVYPDLIISPPEIALPWDSVDSSKSSYQLNASGGDGFYQWSVADQEVALVTQSGVVKPRNVGVTEAFVAIQKNPALQKSAKITIAPPVDLKIVYSSIEAELGSPVYLAVALYYKTDVPGGRRTALFTDCSQFPFNVDVNSQDFFHNSSALTKAPENACATVAIVGNVAATATVTISYLADSTLLQDSATVSVYQPLRVVTPETGKTVLTVGARRYVVVAGGPFPSTGDGHSLTIDYDRTITWLERVDEDANNLRVFVITCRAIGQSRIVFKVVGKPYVGVDAVSSVHEVHVSCARPKSVRLEIADPALQSCPLSFRQKHIVLNNKAIVVKTVVLDEAGNIFDNATSLEAKWSVSNEDLVRIQFQSVLKLRDEDKGRYRVPLYHYQTLAPNMKVGSVDLTASVLSYQKYLLKTLRIDWDGNELKMDQLKDTITLTLVNSVHVSSEYLSVFNHPQNVAKLYITYGSGFYKVSASESNAAQVHYLENSKSVDIVPVLPGTFSLTVKDECLNSDPLRVNVFILTVSRIDVDLIDKVEKGKSLRAVLRLFDSDGNAITEKNMLNLKSETDADIVKVDCADKAKSDERIACTVTGLELGIANVVFRAGPENSVVRSAPIRVQVYPPLQIVPRNMTLVPGAVMQLTAKGGPQPDCVIEYSTNSDVIMVDNSGNVIGDEVGDCVVVGRAVGVRADGEKVVYTEDSVRVHVVYLEGIRVSVPLIKIKAGAKMPIWVEGIPEQIGPLVLASLQSQMRYKWDVSSPNLAQVYNIMEETGVKVADSDKVSMRLRTLKSGRVVVSVTVAAPSNIVRFGHKGVFKDSVNVEIFDGLKIFNDLSQPMLFAPGIKYRMKTNKDRVARITYKSVNDECGAVGNPFFEIDRKGLLVTYNKYGIGELEITSVEDNDFIQVHRVPVKISRVQYMMLNIVPELQVSSDSSVAGLPKGAKLQFYVSYYDIEGSEFTGTNTNIKFKLNKADKLRITQSEYDQNLVLDLLDVGATAIQIYDHDSSITPDFVRLNVLAYVQPDKMKFVVGDAICFTAPKIDVENHECSWNSSNDNSISINKKTGLGVAKSKQSNIVISYQCTNNLQIVTTADVYSLQKVEIIGSGISNISNNGKRYVIPLALRNDVDDPLMWRNTDLPWEKGCMKEGNVFFYPYECSIKISPEGSIHDIESILKVYPNFDFKSGHTCVIESTESPIPLTGPTELNVVVKVRWNRYESTSITIPFKPAINVVNKKLSISDQDPVSTLRISGSPAILSQIQVLPCNSKYIAIIDESSDIKSVAKYSVYLKPAYLKKSLDASQKLSLWVISENTDQNITVLIDVNVNVDHYVTPHHFTDQIMYYANEYAFLVLVSLVFSVVIGFAVSRLWRAIYSKSFADNSFANMSHDRSHLSSPTLLSPTSHCSYKQPSFNEIQMIYGRTNDKMLRPRRN